jgi:hypothetical protein
MFWPYKFRPDCKLNFGNCVTCHGNWVILWVGDPNSCQWRGASLGLHYHILHAKSGCDLVSVLTTDSRTGTSMTTFHLSQDQLPIPGAKIWQQVLMIELPQMRPLPVRYHTPGWRDREPNEANRGFTPWRFNTGGPADSQQTKSPKWGNNGQMLWLLSGTIIQPMHHIKLSIFCRSMVLN